MIFPRNSFRLRLVAGAALWISIGFVVTWLVLANLLRVHVLREFSSELDHHATELAELAVLDPAGGLGIRAPLSDFRFSMTGSGYYWQITQTSGATLLSDSLGGARLPLQLDPAGPAVLHERQIIGPSGEAMLLERLVHIGDQTSQTARVVVAMDKRLISAYVGSLESALALAMACLATGLILAAFAQIAFAFRPLARIEQALLAVKRGDARRLPADLPTEVGPLVDNLNALLDKNEDMIQRARLQAGNLAHSLKSSLAQLQIEADTLTANGQSGIVIQQQCDVIRRQIDYQLARARATASRIGVTPAIQVGPVISSLAMALQRLHKDRNVTLETHPAHADALVHCGAEDLEEVLGNLLDNAMKWAKSRVLISVAVMPDNKVRICIEDDGEGMPPDTRERVFQPGERLDETTPGSGLGLAIARDVVALYDGQLWIDQSSLGGARATVEL